MKPIHIYQHGGIGDQIIALPLIELFRKSGHPLIVYTHFPDILSIFFQNKITIHSREQFRRGELDYWVEFIDIVDFKFNHAKPKDLPEFLQPFYAAFIENSKVWGSVIDAHPHQANIMGKMAVARGLHRWDLPFHLIGQEYHKFEFDMEDGPLDFITIHDGFDASGHYKFDMSMKSWAVPYWESFIAGFKRLYPNIKIYQLGGPKHHVIKGVDRNLAGKLSFRDSMLFLKSALVHVDGDSGLVHARQLFGKPSVVIFGPTNIDYFGYPENINLPPLFCGDCWWKKGDWMKNCVLGYETAKCMESSSADRVLQAVGQIIERSKNVGF